MTEAMARAAVIALVAIAVVVALAVRPELAPELRGALAVLIPAVLDSTIYAARAHRARARTSGGGE